MGPGKREGMRELLLSNGMRVCYKCTDYLDDDVQYSGFAWARAFCTTKCVF